jgi:alcohol dehydrogenase
MEDYRGRGRARGRLLPLFAVPTTAGTGSDVQSFTLIATEDTHEKMACGDPQAAPRIALLDPLLSLTQPPLVTACTGLDALGHAVETAVTRARNEVSDLFSARAFRLIERHLPRVLTDPEDLESRGALLLAAAFAGIAIESSMLGAAHSMANPLTARFGIAHGQAVATALPHVVRYNAEEPAAARLYAALAREARLAPGATDRDAALALAARLSELVELAGLPTSLAASGVGAADAPALAREAAQQWTARFNPRPVEAPDFEGLFRAACAGTGA